MALPSCLHVLFQAPSSPSHTFYPPLTLDHLLTPGELTPEHLILFNLTLYWKAALLLSHLWKSSSFVQTLPNFPGQVWGPFPLLCTCTSIIPLVSFLPCFIIELLALILSFFKFFIYWFLEREVGGKKEREREREREREHANLLFHLFMYSLADSCALA